MSFDTTSTQGMAPALHLLGLCYASAKQCLRGTTCNINASCLQCPSRRLCVRKHPQLLMLQNRRVPATWQCAHLPGLTGADRPLAKSFAPAQRWTHSALVDARLRSALEADCRLGSTNQVCGWLHGSAPSRTSTHTAAPSQVHVCSAFGSRVEGEWVLVQRSRSGAACTLVSPGQGSGCP